MQAQGKRPGLTCRHVTDVVANAVADPFLLRRGDTIYLFFEVMNAATERGEIAYACSQDDGVTWVYGQVVMREAFHLSYPQVFEWHGGIYMIPETRQADGVFLYRAESFPGQWRVVGQLLKGPYADSTLHFDGDTWWLFAQRGLDELCLFQAKSPAGPWRAHPASPLWPGNRRRTRPGGRVLSFDGRVVRFAQDGWPSYGTHLRAFEIDQLDETSFLEHELPESPIFSASRSGWNALAMHHIDALALPDGRWLAAVDGATLAHS